MFEAEETNIASEYEWWLFTISRLSIFVPKWSESTAQ